MIVCRNVLLNGQTQPVNTSGGTNPNPFYFPEHRAWWAEDIVYTIVVESVVGAPTAATATARFQAMQGTTQGLQSVGDEHVNDVTPVWADIASDEWPVVVGTQASVNQMTVLRIKGGISHRLVLDFSFTGGTSPAFILSVESKMRGN